MAQIALNIPDAILTRVINGFANYYHYQSTIDGEANPETKAQFSKRMLVEYIKNAVVASEVQDAANAAATIANEAATNDIVIT